MLIVCPAPTQTPSLVLVIQYFNIIFEKVYIWHMTHEDSGSYLKLSCSGWMWIIDRLFQYGFKNLSIFIKSEKKKITRGEHSIGKEKEYSTSSHDAELSYRVAETHDLNEEDADEPKKEVKHLGIGKKSTKKAIDAVLNRS